MEITWALFLKPKAFIYFTSLLLFTLNFKSGGGKLHIEKESADFDGRLNDFKSLSCSVTGDGEKTYKWYHNGNLIDPQYFSNGFISTNSDTLNVNPRSVNREYEGIYQLFVSSAFGRIFCRKIKVRFKVAGDFERDSSLPDIRKVVEGQPFRLSCPKHTYMRGCSYKWGGNSHVVGMRFVKEYRNRVVLPDGTLFFSTITKQDMMDFGWQDGGYQCIMDCVFTGSFHKMTRSHKVGLNATGVNASSFGPTIITKIKDSEVILGSGYVHVTCAAAGSPTPSYRWAKIDADDNAVGIRKTKDIEFGNFNHTMTIQNINISHNGTYACIATSGDNYDMVKWKIIVREKPTWLSDGMIKNKEVDVFTNFTWNCKARGDPVPTYTWYSNASQMETRSVRYKIDGGKILFSRVLLEDIGMYQCVAENGFGYIYQTVSLLVRARKPEFNKSSINVVFLKDFQGILRCQSNAIPRADYTWTKNGIPLTFGTKYNVEGGELLIINMLTEEDAGVYKCTAENVFGKAEQVINVAIEDIKFVVKPTSNRNVTKGSSFSLYCKVESSRQVKYKWRLNGRDLKYDDNHIWLESVNRLLIQNVNESDSGKYECVAYLPETAKMERSVTASILVTGPPNAVKGFHLIGKCNNFTAALSWHSLPIYNISDTVVIIEWRTTYDLNNSWHRVPGKVNATVGQAKVDLSPWSKFRFRAIAQNSYGDSPPCEPTEFKSCVTPPSRPDKCPENILAMRGAPGVLDIKWNAMTAIDFNGPGFNYVVKYKRPNDSKWTKTVLDRTEEQFTIPNAGTNQLLHFTLQANNSEGLGPMCLENSSYSGQSKPGFISELIVKDIRTSSVLITWPPPISDLWNIDGYRLEYGEVGAITSKKKRSKNDCYDIHSNPCFILFLQESKCQLSGLKQETQYNISLKAYNSQGNGPPKYSAFQTASIIFSEKSGSPMYKRNWFITIISIIVLLMFIILFIIFVLNIRRSDRYLVGKRERKKGGFLNLDDNRHDLPEPNISPPQEKRASPDKYSKSSTSVSNGSTLALRSDEVSLALSTEDKYDDDGSFVGEYSDMTLTKKYEEMFV